MFETADDVHLARQKLLQEFLGRQVVVHDLHRQVSSGRQMHRLLDHCERTFAQLVSEAIPVLEEHHLQIDGAFHMRHDRLGGPWLQSVSTWKLALSLQAQHVTS